MVKPKQMKFFRDNFQCGQLACYFIVLWAKVCANQTRVTAGSANHIYNNNTTHVSANHISTNRTDLGKNYKFPSLGKEWGAYSPLCPIAFFRLANNCYFYGYFPLNWFRAAEFCHSLGQAVALAVIENKDENSQLKAWLKVHGNRNKGVWIGGSENGHFGKWAWFPTGNLVNYKNWGPSQPSGGDQHCMYMVGGILGYQWADFHCDFEMNFLCQYNVNEDRPW